MRLTGERTFPSVAIENYWFRRHEAAYGAFAPVCNGATVLDVGAGEGYGADILAVNATRTIALEYDALAAAHIKSAYGRLDVLRGNAVRLPIADGSVDVVAALQVVEHLWDQEGFVAECARVLQKAGMLVLSTPNSLTFPPGNPFHSRELSAAELTRLLAPHFAALEVFGLRHGRRLRRLDRRHGGSIVAAQLAVPPAVWHPVLRRDVKSVRASDFVTSQVDIDESLDLLVVAARPRRISSPDR